MDTFDPNDPRKGDWIWATFQPHRRPAFKLHMNRGPALTSCGAEAWYILYNWSSQESKWVEVCRVDNRRHHVICHHCGRDTSSRKPQFYSMPLSWYWVGQPFLREVGLCEKCNDYQGPLRAMMNAPIDKRTLIQHPNVPL
jgi:hypothetical protein